MSETKTCRKCEETKPASDFRFRSKAKNSRSGDCRSCENSYRREWRKSGGTKKPVLRDKANSLSVRNPNLAAELSPKEPLSAEELPYRSSYEALWMCKEGHEWSGSVDERTNGGIPCPECPLPDRAIDTIQHISDWLKNLDQETRENSLEVLSSCTEKSYAKVSLACPVCKEKIIINIRNFRGRCLICSVRKDSLATCLSPDLLAEFDFERNELPPEDISYNSAKQVSWKCEDGHRWSTASYQRVNSRTGCPECHKKSKSSKAEHELIEWLRKSLDETEIVVNSRSVISPYELDIYIPSKKIAIEFNGLYWHSEARGKDRNYHRNKWSLCKEKGIQLLQVWEDEWEERENVVKRSILHKLGISQEIRVYARNTNVHQISKIEAEQFLTNNHIQGYASGGKYLALKEKAYGKIISVMVLKESRDGFLNIIRYATNCFVIGGFTKLLRYAEITFTPKGFITFSDNMISDGSLYSSNGFALDKEIRQDYMYIADKKRKHKFSYRLKRFKNDPSLKWVEGLSEKQLAELNKLDRVWDAGKIRWIKIL